MTDPAVESFLVLSAARLAPRTVEAYRRDLTDLAAHLGGSPAAATTAQLETYVAQMRAAGLANTTIARRIAAVRSFFRHQMLLGARQDNPAVELDLPRRRRALPKTLSPGEAERLIDAATGVTPRALRDQALVELLYGAGLRVSEAVGLDKAGVDVDERLVRVIGKGSKERIVPIGRRAADALNRYLARGRPYLDRRHRSELFLNAQGGALTRAGAREDEWRFPSSLPPSVRQLAKGAGLNPRELTARTLTTVGGRRRPALSAGDARPRRSRHDRALHARIRSAASRVVFPGTPSRSEEVDEKVNDARSAHHLARRRHTGDRVAHDLRRIDEERPRAEATAPYLPVVRQADPRTGLL